MIGGDDLSGLMTEGFHDKIGLARIRVSWNFIVVDPTCVRRK